MGTLLCNTFLSQPTTSRIVLTSTPDSNYFHRLVAGSKKRKLLSPEEQDIRRKEDAIFNELSKQPTPAVGFERSGDDGKAIAAAKKSLINQEDAAKKTVRKSGVALAKFATQKTCKK